MLKLLLTCEHGGNQVPAVYSSFFEGKESQLSSHEGYDIGALELFRELEPLADKTFHSETTRLLVELNRSLHHAKLFSDVTRQLHDNDKSIILKEHYFPYREQVEHFIHDFIMAGRQVLHISVHSFTPNLNGETRETDIGLLYDPKRKLEQTICRRWKQEFQNDDKELLVRFNYPYLGIADGFPTYLRRKFTDEQYIGVELEVNQKYYTGDRERWEHVKQTIYSSLQNTLTHFRPELHEEEEEL
ncbi:N-formylglutamate amidohydrolase [Pontibacter sp. BT310]|uniref:N-formylglutamate amidohydrolase n=1 Tax=Pontibacter populi TaxID=890055 RepID=A0ABS6XA19_9BACT|nr:MULTISPECIES: N-formylglutamate amidohydrolase [Pontibacter]MBJ6117868.1 N-formylglutamate amidohydrolase [Pontibacter sp. BT310]MBR0570295.1 N-formylglutamate amidohydrolase [Microvirga sp. STS03]MBW3364721.1 N-formylglutamate amidohydrolase [Pontibacter populi]